MIEYHQKKIVKKVISTDPIPILYPEKRLILLWNAKSGSTFAIKWMFAQMGLLEKASKYHNWVHNYRSNVYYKSKDYKAGEQLFLNNLKSFNAIKIVVNPFKRAVDSYIQACIHGYEDKKLSVFLKRNINPKIRFSFREFADYLSSIDITGCDIHHKMQTSELERKDYLRSLKIIHLEDSMQEIPLFEKIHNLKKIDLSVLRKSPHHRPKYKTSEFMGDVVMNKIYKVRKPTLPEYQQFYDEEIIEIIKNVYQEDFERYNYEMKLDLGNIDENR